MTANPASRLPGNGPAEGLAAQLSVYAVTHRFGSDEQLLAELEQALAAGVRIVQLREKACQGAELECLARRVQTVTAAHGALLIINDDARLARAVGADGVHLGQSDGSILAARSLLGPNALIGATAHNVEEAIAAQRQGADYLGVGDVFGTASKPDTIPMSAGTLRAIVAEATIPIVAIGGISAENAHRLAGSGIDGFAVISAIFGRTDIPAQVARLQAAAALLKRSPGHGLNHASGHDANAMPDADSQGADRRGAVMAKALTIAGSDCSGGAGIQADLKTMTVHGVYGMSAITALTAQNTTGVQGILDVSPEFVAQQLDSIFTDIRPDSIKIGMVANAAIISRIAAKLREFNAAHVVVDPVMVATSGSSLMADSAVATLVSELFPLAELVTPNRFEAETLCGFAIATEADMERAAASILGFGCRAVLVKGGHIGETASDYLATAEGGQWLHGPRIENPNTHGTGCTLSTAIACNLASGYDLPEAVRRAKAYLTSAIAAGLDLGKGRGPLLHMTAGRMFAPFNMQDRS